MPTHIGSFRRLSDPKMAAAKSALNRLIRDKHAEGPCIKIEGDTIEYTHRKNPQNLYRFAERFDLDKDDVIDFAKIQFRSPKESSALRQYLKSKGFFCIARNMYSKHQTVQAGETL